MSRLPLIVLIWILASFQILPVWAQKDHSVKDKVEEFTSAKGTPVQLGYMEVSELEDFTYLANEVPADQYPIVVIEKQDFRQKISQIRKLQVEALEYVNLTDELARQDSIDNLKEAVYQEIVAAEKERADRLKETNTQLNLEITHLSEQIDRTVDTGQKSLRGRNLKNFMIGILGAGVGFASGLVLGVIGGI